MINDNIVGNDHIKKRVLLVDDEFDITTVYAMGLQDNGFKVDTFNDPLQALSEFKRGWYDFALIDYKMPKMSGSELYQKIMKVDDKVKVCFITAFDVYHGEIKKEFQNDLNAMNHVDKGRLYEQCFIQKPIDIDELVKKIKEVLSS
jgi:two-component system catabolic regulation response regulator CreB/two-component system response regulator ChvI